jgi:hypothetical protein
MIARPRRGVHALRGVYRRFSAQSRIACPEYFWEVDFGKRINHVMSLGASVRSGDYEFGDAGSVAFVMTFSF